MDILIAEDELTVSDALLAHLEEKNPSVRWFDLDNDLKQAYARRVSLLDGELRCELVRVVLSDCVAFYNAYYWAVVFARRYQARYGFDAGIEQEVFKVLERAPADVDWQVVEAIGYAAQQV